MSQAVPHIQPAFPTDVDIPQLKALAVSGLVQMFDSDKKLFCFRLKRSKHGLIREGLSHRYTIISLLGLHQLETTGLRSPIELKPALENLLKETSWLTNLGDLGLLLWLCALASPDRLEELSKVLDVPGALNRYRESREGRTMELAWFLAGLSHQALAYRGKPMECADRALKTFHLLKNNQGEKGIFRHLARGASLAGALRGRIGSLADQVYPIYALAQFAQAFESKEALAMASACAEAICRAQGPLGQWWWHYDSSSGGVAGRYPVYSVHQDGMAPMALFALGEAAQADFNEPICKGLQWIYGNNELGLDLRHISQNTIWRGIYRKRIKIYSRAISSLLTSSGDAESHDDLTVRFECRPYHLGWLLYAFARHPEPSTA